MASTNKTPNLGLNQWVLDDPLLMEDVNTDNQKIDTAVAGLQGQLGAMPYVKLFDITTTADAEQVDLDLSGLDLSQFAKLEIYAYLYRHNSGNILLRLNNGGGHVRGSGSYGSTQHQDYITYVGASATEMGKIYMKLFGFQSPEEMASYNICMEAQSVSYNAGNYDVIYAHK